MVTSEANKRVTEQVKQLERVTALKEGVHQTHRRGKEFPTLYK